MSVGGTQQSLRKALGAIKDSTKVGLAKVNSDYKELDVAIVKATNHVERPAKEKHIQAIFATISATRPRADVAYCIHALARRLAKTHNWAVALKTLIVIHRALREVDPTFREELINYGRSRSHMLNLAHFKDDSSPNAWDYSAWVRTYAHFLEERLECFRVLNYDIETDRPLYVDEQVRCTLGMSKAGDTDGNLLKDLLLTRTRDLETVELLEHLPALQQLLFRLLACQPQGAATYNFVIQLALSLVAGESIKIHSAISDGTINLVDKFFEMQRHHAIKALDIYRKAAQQAERLSEFYEICKNLDLQRGEKFIKIEQPSASFITAMEEYVKDAPRASSVRRDQVIENKIAAPKVVLALEDKKVPEVQEEPVPTPPSPPPEPIKAEDSVSESSDLLGLNNSNPVASELDEKNSMALAIVPAENPSNGASSGLDVASGTTGWELALVTAPSSNESAMAASKLAGGLDKLTLDSLYDDALRRTNQMSSYNPWEAVPVAGPFMQQAQNDPFYASSAVAAPPSVQMASMAHQQQAFMLQQQQQQSMVMGQQPQQPALNPFGNPYGGVPYSVGMPPPIQTHNPYSSLI